MNPDLKVALIQQHAGSDRRSNLERGLAAVRSAAAAGAQLLCFAELAFDRFFPQRRASSREQSLRLAETVPGPTTDALARLARELNVTIVGNLFERDGEHTYDTSPVIDADGTLLGKTRMVHIADFEGFRERDYYRPGDAGAPVYDTACGRIGVAICYDRHFPEYMRALGLARADVVLVPQAGTVGEWPAGLYEAELRVAAFQNGYFVALCNRVGREHDLDFAGHSFVCDPHGEIIGQAKAGEDDILICRLDASRLADSPARRHFLGDRRPEVYRDWFG